MDINVIAENLTQLLQNSVNMTSVFYDIFLNPEPMDVELVQYNEEGQLVTVLIPNRAKENQRAIIGQGSPEGRIDANEGALYVDQLALSAYVKVEGSGNNGWRLITTIEGVYEYIQQYLGEQGYLDTQGLANYLSVNHYTTESNVSDIVSRIRGTLVTTISEDSTDEEYPSAKCVWDLLGGIETALDNIIQGE